MRLWIATLAILLFWILWIEFGKGMGNVWLRMDTTGERVFHPQGVWAMLIAPWRELAAGRTWLWWPSYWDLNVWIWVGLLGGFFRIYTIQQQRPPTNQDIQNK